MRGSIQGHEAEKSSRLAGFDDRHAGRVAIWSKQKRRCRRRRSVQQMNASLQTCRRRDRLVLALEYLAQNVPCAIKGGATDIAKVPPQVDGMGVVGAFADVVVGVDEGLPGKYAERTTALRVRGGGTGNGAAVDGAPTSRSASRCSSWWPKRSRVAHTATATTRQECGTASAALTKRATLFPGTRPKTHPAKTSKTRSRAQKSGPRLPSLS